MHESCRRKVIAQKMITQTQCPNCKHYDLYCQNGIWYLLTEPDFAYDVKIQYCPFCGIEL